MALKRLSEIINGLTFQLHELPLVHTTKTEHMRNIISAQCLAPRLCPVFNEALLYLFYGKPAYRIAKPDKPTTEVIYSPVCFVFKPYSELTSLIRRIYPFDSGAGASGRFQPHVTPDELDRFFLDPIVESAKRIVGLFFGDNRRYYWGQPKGTLEFSLEDTSAAKYYTLQSERGILDYDDRRSAIEFQAYDKLVLRESLLAVVLPEFLLDDTLIWDAIRDWRTVPITYGSATVGIPSEYSAVIREKLDVFYRDRNLF